MTSTTSWGAPPRSILSDILDDGFRFREACGVFAPALSDLRWTAGFAGAADRFDFGPAAGEAAWRAPETAPEMMAPARAAEPATAVRIEGIEAGGFWRRALAGAGDVDRDGRADVLLGAPAADARGREDAGRTYLLFGSALAAELSGDGRLDVGGLTRGRGVLIRGAAGHDQSGRDVAAAGDVDGDGRADVLVVAQPEPDLGGTGPIGANKIYLLFGSALAAETTAAGDGVIDLGALTGRQGVAIVAQESEAYSGMRVAAAGDIDLDGRSELLIGANYAGRAFLLWGQALATEKGRNGDGLVDLSDLDRDEGVRIRGSFDERTGFSVAAAGDIDRDGRADVLIGGIANPDAGVARAPFHLLFGSALAAEKRPGGDGFLDLAGLTRQQGVLIEARANRDFDFPATAAGGDVDRDGRPDILIATPTAGAGAVFLLFGAALAAEKAGGDGRIDLAALARSEGVRIAGGGEFRQAGLSVAFVDDLDGDGRSDVAIGDGSGFAHVIYGAALAAERQDDGLIQLASLTRRQGVHLEGSSGTLAAAGDVDGDGRGDLLVGGPFVPDGASEAFLLTGALLAAEKADDGAIDLGGLFLA